MYPTFDHWAYVDHLLPMLTMYSPCTHWVFGPSPPVSARELLATSSEVRKQVKELVASKKVSTNLLEEEVVDSFLSSCFEQEASRPMLDMRRYDVSSAAVSLPLRVIFPSFGHGVEPECILDGGAQIVVMRKDIWQRLRAPISAAKAMSMESANAGKTMTLGLVENLPLTIGAITVLLQVQIVEDAPFEVLLGRPFFDVTSCVEVSRSGGSHQIQLRCPKTQAPYVFATQPRLHKTVRVKQESPVNFRI
jgi:hypothetical protein